MFPASHPIPFPDLDCVHWLDVGEPEEPFPPSESTDKTSASISGTEEA
ncbi:MAG: hypothetical protein JHC84_05370 [Solirubrobacteraceae bacterium]|nr:hypothetical protein [Solirubrobacteraceae bacterium]